MQIGTSGWQYAHWRGRLYPERLPQRLWLEHYAERFSCVEVTEPPSLHAALQLQALERPVDGDGCSGSAPASAIRQIGM